MVKSHFFQPLLRDIPEFNVYVINRIYNSVRSSYTTTPSRSNGMPDKFCDLDRHSAMMAASSLRIRLRRFLLKFI